MKLLTKELEALKEAGMKAADSLKVAEAANLELEKQVRGKDWEIKDTTAIKDAQYCIIPLIKKGENIFIDCSFLLFLLVFSSSSSFSCTWKKKIKAIKIYYKAVS